MKQITSTKNFIRLDRFYYGQYNFIYNINNGYCINESLKKIEKHQLLFKKISNSKQQLNMMFVDSIFHNILADFVIEVLQNKIKTFKEYCDLKSKRSFFATTFSKTYFEIKFKQYFRQLLFGYTSLVLKNDQDDGAKNIYYLKNGNTELEYFSIYEQNQLSELLFNKLILSINFTKSVLKTNSLKVNFEIIFF